MYQISHWIPWRGGTFRHSLGSSNQLHSRVAIRPNRGGFVVVLLHTKVNTSRDPNKRTSGRAVETNKQTDKTDFELVAHWCCYVTARVHVFLFHHSEFKTSRPLERMKIIVVGGHSTFSPGIKLASRRLVEQIARRPFAICIRGRLIVFLLCVFVLVCFVSMEQVQIAIYSLNITGDSVYSPCWSIGTNFLIPSNPVRLFIQFQKRKYLQTIAFNSINETWVASNNNRASYSLGLCLDEIITHEIKVSFWPLLAIHERLVDGNGGGEPSDHEMVA